VGQVLKAQIDDFSHESKVAFMLQFWIIFQAPHHNGRGSVSGETD
jgi:hypothetical protein